MEINSSEVSSKNFSQELLMSPGGYVAAAVILSLIGFFGFFLNLLVILLMCRDKKLRTPLNMILFNLVVSDFMVSIMGNPWTLTSAIAQGWIFGKTMCVVYGFFMALLGIASITTLTVLAFERFLIVSKPFNTKFVNRCSAIYMIFGIWIYSLLLTTPPLIGWGKYVNEAANISCSVNWEDRTYNAKTYILYLFAFGLLVPLVIITFSYVHIIRTMRKKRLKTGKLSRVEGRIAYMVLVMIAAFLVAWTPYSVFALIAQFGDPSLMTRASGVLPALLAKSSICYNPIIYVGLNSQFRESLKQFLQSQNLTSSSFISVPRPTQYLSQTAVSMEELQKIEICKKTTNENQTCMSKMKKEVVVSERGDVTSRLDNVSNAVNSSEV